MVTLHIQRAQLSSAINSYVRVELLDDDSHRLDHSTSVYSHTEYNEHISWEMNVHDYTHELRVSVYERHLLSGDAKCVGYVKIHMKLLLKRDQLSQWFQLDTVQPSQPIPARTRPSTTTQQTKLTRSTLSRISTNTLPMTKVLIVRPSPNTSYGMSVAGTGPTHIIRVQRHSAADRAGLVAGDLICSVENIDVKEYSREHLVQLLKQQSVLTEICVQRTHSTQQCTQVLHQSLPSTVSTTMCGTNKSTTHHLSFIMEEGRYVD